MKNKLNIKTPIITLLIITICPLAFAQNTLVPLDSIFQQVTEVYKNDTAAAQRIAVWKQVIDALDENNAENKRQVADFLAKMMTERLGTRVTRRITDINILINLLKTFSKEEAVYILYVWIQSGTNPQKLNGKYDSPETFLWTRTGDCTEVAWLAETVCKELDIKTKVFILRYSFVSHAFTGHAFTGLEFIENNITKRYIIDNSNLYNLSPEDSWKNNIWQIFSQKSDAWRYIELDTSLWHKVRRDSEDPQLRATKKYIIYVPIPRDIAVKEFAKYKLLDYLDDTSREILFFRDDFRQTISDQKKSGVITKNEHDRLYDLWETYENDGLKIKFNRNPFE